LLALTIRARKQAKGRINENKQNFWQINLYHNRWITAWVELYLNLSILVWVNNRQKFLYLSFFYNFLTIKFKFFKLKDKRYLIENVFINTISLCISS
jgi:hypothetical protein